jgi:hypothetical protein
MILELEKKPPATVTLKKTGWPTEIRRRLYRKNKQSMQSHRQVSSADLEYAREVAGRKVMNTVELNPHVGMHDRSSVEGCHTHYCAFIPLKMQAKFDDELDSTFPYFKFLTEKGRIHDRQAALAEIS